MKLWRVEDIHGVGLHSKLVADHDPEYDLITPTAFNMAITDWCPFDDDVRAQVPPEDDDRLMHVLSQAGLALEDHLFAFSAARQMRNYLYRDSWILNLHKFEMYVALYWVEEGVLIGDHQVLMPKGLQPLERWRIGHYFGLVPE